ncbi:unnamed protein product, partial [Didymodactylos carnosus]
YSVTIVVEGGISVLEVMLNDIHAERPIILILGTGRMADVIGNLIQLTSNADQNIQREPTRNEIRCNLLGLFPILDHIGNENELNTCIEQINEIMTIVNRKFLYVDRLNRDQNITETIFKTIFSAYQNRNCISIGGPLITNRKRFFELACKLNYFDGIKQVVELINSDKEIEIEKMKRSVQQSNQSSLANVTALESVQSLETFTLSLFRRHNFYNRLDFASGVRILNASLKRYVGPYIRPIYSSYDPLLPRPYSDHYHPRRELEFEKEMEDLEDYDESPIIQRDYTQQEMFRDLFIWSVFMNFPKMAKVFLSYLEPRICASLIASKVFKKCSEEVTDIDLKQKFELQALEFEIYAAKCVDTCYEHSKDLACELLLRQIPLFGNVTCMQVAISAESTKFLETACFDQVLNRVWYDKLTLLNQSALSSQLKLFGSIVTLGLTAPLFLEYRKRTLHDLFAFIYLIFIAIVAYGVVSRALIMHGQVEFTLRGIFENILYPPYWFIHGEIDDREKLDGMINNGTSKIVAEATVTHVLLALHMLFINILLLNLLIAVFTSTNTRTGTESKETVADLKEQLNVIHAMLSNIQIQLNQRNASDPE